MNNPMEIANTLNDYFLNVVGTFIRNQTEDNNDPWVTMNPLSYLPVLLGELLIMLANGK
jgi:hypothetical protein